MRAHILSVIKDTRGQTTLNGLVKLLKQPGEVVQDRNPIYRAIGYLLGYGYLSRSKEKNAGQKPGVLSLTDKGEFFLGDADVLLLQLFTEAENESCPETTIHGGFHRFNMSPAPTTHQLGTRYNTP